MKYFFDTEFCVADSDVPVPRSPGSPGGGRTVIGISIGILSEDGRELELALQHDDEVTKKVNPWLIENVYKYLPPRHEWVDAATASTLILNFFGDDETIELWAYHAGGQKDLFVIRSLSPELRDRVGGVTLNLAQAAKVNSVPRSSFPPQPRNRHSALADAYWNRDLYSVIFS